MTTTITSPGDLLPALPAREPAKFYEIVNGKRREIRPMSARAGSVVSMLLFPLGKFVRDHSLGLVLIEVLVALREKQRLWRQPDMLFVSYDRLPNPLFPPNTDPPALDAVPNLAVEIVHSSDLAVELMAKIKDYFQAGIQCLWLIFPHERTAYVYDGPKSVRILTEEDELDGGTALPGFRLSVAALFQEATQTKPSGTAHE
jgi:Uma2 family endonuclease